MRDIKFRVWNNSIKRMYQVIMIWLGEVQGIQYVDFETSNIILTTTVAKEDLTLEQYTGLKDKNGKEIYEGDKFKDSSGVSIVCWNEKYCSWCLRRLDWMYDHFFGEAVSPEDGEIIGTIHDKEIK